jgi:uncharacterized membrane protein YfcA
VTTLVLLALAGFGAQLVDGALGMGYGVTSTTLLLLAGLSPAAASASVHLAKIGTALASGYAHWRFGNVDRALVLRLGVPGAVGALLGALLLSHLSAEASAPLMGTLLLAIGAFILVRYAVRPPRVRRRTGAGSSPRSGSSAASSTPPAAGAGVRSRRPPCSPPAAPRRAP